MYELTYEETVSLFKQWGFEVEPGPRTDEVTLLSKTEGGCTYSVQERATLAQMAAAALAVRWRSNRVMQGDCPSPRLC